MGVAAAHPARTETNARAQQIRSNVAVYPEWTKWAVYGLMLAAVLLRFFYWHYTHRTWEDALIAALHSENAARGLGLTHLQPPGEPPVQGFTSPVGVLIPLIGDLIHVGWGVSLLKLVSAFAAAVAVWFGVRISQVLRLPVAMVLTVAAYLALDYHQILWGMAGMETQVLTVAYLWSICAMLRGTQWQKGLSFGFLLLIRPDAAIWVAIAFAVELWRAAKTRSWRRLVPIIAGTVLLYAPWLIFAFFYYGSPVPNTILAKSMGYPTVGMQFHALHFLGKLVLLRRRFLVVFAGLGPSYAGNGTFFLPLWDHRSIALIMVVLATVGLAAAFGKRQADALLLYSFVVSYPIYLIACANFIFGWYTVPILAVTVICSMYGLHQILLRFTTQTRLARIAALFGVLYILSLLSVLPSAMRSDSCIQKYVEDEGRKQIGLYLARVSYPTDTIFSESVGYIGYYSGRVIYDYPGLCNRDVVEFFRTHPQERSLQAMAEAFRPTYLVFRPFEYKDGNGNIRLPWVQQDYELVRVFKVPDSAKSRIIGSQTNIDLEFDIFRKKTAPVRSN